MSKLLLAAALLGAFANALPTPDTNATIAIEKRDLIGALPENAHATELRYQPYFDFDQDGCYQTSAIDPSGRLNNGLPRTGGVVSNGCRDPQRLKQSKTYARRRCNNNICGIIYAYYYEKDAAWNADVDTVLLGHTHDWEHVVVFTGPGDSLLGASVSQHGGYEQKRKGEFPTSKDGKRPIVVYHKDGGSTHCHRFANMDDIKHYENFSGNSWRAPLVGWLGWPAGLRDLVMYRNWGEANIALTDYKDKFAKTLEAAGARNFGLDPYGPDDQPH